MHLNGNNLMHHKKKLDKYHSKIYQHFTIAEKLYNIIYFYYNHPRKHEYAYTLYSRCIICIKEIDIFCQTDCTFHI